MAIDMNQLQQLLSDPVRAEQVEKALQDSSEDLKKSIKKLRPTE